MAHRNRAEQQETEKRHIEEFLRRKGISEPVEYGDRPDAVLFVDGRLIGLEHRELTEPDLAANSRNLGALPELLRSEMEKLGLAQNLSVEVHVNSADPVLRKLSQVKKLAEGLVRVASEFAPATSADKPVKIAAPALTERGLAGVTSVMVNRLRTGELRGDSVRVSSGFWGPGDASLYAAVREKEKRIPEYKAARALDEVWLLLVTGESWVQATDSELMELLQIRLTSDFDAVYMLDLLFGQLQRLDDGSEE